MTGEDAYLVAQFETLASMPINTKANSQVVDEENVPSVSAMGA